MAPLHAPHSVSNPLFGARGEQGVHGKPREGGHEAGARGKRVWQEQGAWRGCGKGGRDVAGGKGRCHDLDTPFFFIILSLPRSNPQHLILNCTCADSPVPYEAMLNLALKAVR